MLEFGPLLPADGIELIFYRSWYGLDLEQARASLARLRELAAA